MRHILLFDSSCSACSKAAKAVAQLGVDGLEVRGLADPAMLAALQEAGLAPPRRPGLLSGEGADARLRTGWAMRRELARLVGWRSARRILRLASIEARGRAERTSGISRRRLLGGGLAAAAGAIGSAILPESASAATSPPPTIGSTPATAAQIQSATGTGAAQTAVNTWGAVDTTAGTVSTNGSTSVLIVGFTNASDMMLWVDITPGATSSTALAVKDSGGALDFFKVDGTELGTITIQSDGTATAHVAASAAPNVWWKYYCFLLCLATRPPGWCRDACQTCATTHNWLERAIKCAECGWCMAPYYVICAAECGL